MARSSSLDLAITIRDFDVGDLVVAEKARGQGVGKLLLWTCETLASEAGQKYFQLKALGQNQSARSFYKSEGFGDFYVRLEKKL